MIKEIFNLSPLIRMLKTKHKDPLVIFDVDDVLITPSSEDNLSQQYRNQLLTQILNKLKPKEIELLQSSIYLHTKYILVEPKIIPIFEYLKSYKIATMALTAMGTGKFGFIHRMHDFRFKQLDKVNLSFKGLSPLDDEHVMVPLANVNKRFFDINCLGHPMLKFGIIFTSGIDKGVVLEYIFKRYNYYPKTVIFVDDLMENIASLQQLCIKLNIDFYGFHYRAASLIEVPNVNESLEKLRFEILAKEFMWVSYKQLRDIIYSFSSII